MERPEYQTVILAAFLHDIGKFLGRGDFKILEKGQHPGFSSTFISAQDSFFSTIYDKIINSLDLAQKKCKKREERLP